MMSELCLKRLLRALFAYTRKKTCFKCIIEYVVIVCLLYVRQYRRMWRWRNEFSFCCHTEVNLQTLLPVLLPDQRTHSLWTPSFHSVPRVVMPFSDNSLLSYSCMPSAFHSFRITEHASPVCWLPHVPLHLFSPPCFSLLTILLQLSWQTLYLCLVSCPFSFRVFGAELLCGMRFPTPNTCLLNAH